MLKNIFASLLLFICLVISACNTSKQLTGSTVKQKDVDSTLEGIGEETDEITIERLFIDGCKAKALGDFDGAIILFKEILQLDPNNDATLYELAKIYFDYSRLDDARELSKKAVELNPDNEYYLVLYGETLLYQGRFSEAAEVFEKQISLFPQNMDGYLELTYAYERSGNVKESMRVLQDTEKQFGPDMNLLMEQYRFYMRNGFIDQAIDVLNKLIISNPDEPTFLSMLIEVYESAGKMDLAQETFNQLLVMDPNNADLLFKKAQFDRRAGDMNAYQNDLRLVFSNPDANIDRKVFFLVPYIDSVDLPAFTEKEFIIELATLMVQAHPQEAKSYAMRADLYYYTDRKVDARKDYRTSANLRPDVFDVWVKLFYIDAELNANDSLLEVTNEALDLFPNQGLAHFFNGVANQNLKNNDAALISFKRAIPLTSGNMKLRGEAYLRMGDIYNELKEYAASDEAYDNSLDADPDNPYTLNNYAYYLSLRSDKLDKAAAMAERANQLVPNNSSLEDTYAWVLYKQKKYGDAKIWLQKAMQNGGSTSAVVNEHYGDVSFQLGNTDEAVEYWEKAKSLGGNSPQLENKINDRKLYE
ncbi:MAG: tetratricopeptide repeat protein [Chitinophagales bacterium]|nr:tetratricopeptide repeat protein [Bacteroidota bacterium]MBP7399686.1 tetratricopeptide repeat protein [Chitinophagales bacterium]MBP9548712.1 tetratricopeptide repeat protein [Chitinophagales bacterium]MBP9705388.1 tetratricopeptide repeat protein [Chitinophagales bacterium]